MEKNTEMKQTTMKRALISVSDKAGLVELLRPLAAEGLEIISTGGTKKHLLENGFQVLDISEYTGFPEVLDGRVKTLHPFVHMGILATASTSHQQTLQQHHLKPIDLVVCNLYPFEKTFQKFSSEMSDTLPEDLIEDIDIGGVTLLRAAAKNFQQVVSLCDPADYPIFLEKRKNLDFAARKYFASQAFHHTAYYDSTIALAFEKFQGPESISSGIPVHVHQNLRYGENPHQKAVWMRGPENFGLHLAKQHHGKELSYNNLLDLHACCELTMKSNEPICVAVKHNNPCGVATCANIDTAVDLALKADPVSVFGGIVAMNRKVSAEAAEKLANLFLECVIAPEFTAEALQIFSKKKNLRVLEWKDLAEPSSTSRKEWKSILGGFLTQETDAVFSNREQWKFIGEKPSDQILSDLQFGEKVVAQLKSNAIAIVAQGMSVGLGMGQVNRVDAVEQAIARMKKHHPGIQNVILASDAFFPFPDSIELIAKAGIRWVLQPGGSMKDDEVILACEKNKVNLVMTGTRHFRH